MKVNKIVGIIIAAEILIISQVIPEKLPIDHIVRLAIFSLSAKVIIRLVPAEAIYPNIIPITIRDEISSTFFAKINTKPIDNRLPTKAAIKIFNAPPLNIFIFRFVKIKIPTNNLAPEEIPRT